MNSKTNVIIVGYGNIGRGVQEAIKNNNDMKLVGIVSRRAKEVKSQVGKVPVFDFDNFSRLEADVAILCGGSKNDLPKQAPRLAQFYNTVDSFDTHADIPKYFGIIDSFSKMNNKVAIISTGWDPGTFSLERVLADAFMPKAKFYTFWGPGVSQGHSDAVRQVNGVADARSYTLPIEDSVLKVRAGRNPLLAAGQKHTRYVYVVAKDGVNQEKIRKEIENMPNYFKDYHTTVEFISEQAMKERHSKYPHGGFVIATGKTGNGNKTKIEYKCNWESNPEATGNIMVAYARAACRMSREGKSGAYTVLDVPASYVSPRSKEELLAKFM